MDDRPEYIDQFMKIPDIPDGGYSAPPTTSPAIFVEQSEAQPMYLEMSAETDTSQPRTTPLPPPDDSYDSPHGWQNKTKRSSPTPQTNHIYAGEVYKSPDRDVYDDPDKDINMKSPSPSLHRVADSNNMYMSLDQNTQEKHVYESSSPLVRSESPSDDVNVYESLKLGSISVSVQQEESGYYNLREPKQSSYVNVPTQNQSVATEKEEEEEIYY